MTAYYRCQGLRAIAINRVRGVDDAARMFAHRLALHLFGRSGRMLAIERVRHGPTIRVRHGPRWYQYCARIGKRRGPTTDTMLLVELINKQ